MSKFNIILLLFFLKLKFLQSQNPKRCDFIKNNQFLEYCRGVYPQEVSIKYHDYWIKVGEPFILYRSKITQTEYIVSFKHSPLHNCKIIEIISTLNFTCVQHQQKDQELKPLFLNVALGACFPMNLYVTDDLLRICLHQNKRNEKFKKSSKSVLHYALDPELTSGGGVAVGVGIIGNWIWLIYHLSLKWLIAFMYLW
ncbi:uncharacterized protein LOC111676419 [Lucilia cuprina]|uniref:uncharacterized protein LOC111676419 n=1 Tax=Lucilia cuprina TaxID=7375 RepID=UPI001F06D8E4|nr:uncharacterized protein LOC111676419 [Lucilia cuprina]